MVEATPELKAFLWAHHNKEKKWKFNIIYNWKADEAWDIVDFTKGEDRYHRSHNFTEYKSYSIKFLGDVINVTLPVFRSDLDLSSAESVKQDYLKLINIYIKSWMFSDRRWTIISKLLDNFDVVQYNWAICFIEVKKFDESEIIFKSKTESFQIEDSKFHLDVEDQSNIWDYEMVMLLVKEVQDWYYDVKTHSLVDFNEWQLIQQDYKIWRDVTIVMKDKEIISVDQKDTSYSATREKDWWFVITPSWEKISCIDFKPYSLTSNGDWTITIKLIWAYTHMLRNMLDFKPLSWQYNMLMGQKRITFVAWCRRSGKCISPNSRLRLADWTFKLAKDLQIWEELLSSDKTNPVIIKNKEVYNKDIYRITLDNWMVKEVTWDHRCPTQHTYSKDWRDLNIDNYKLAKDLTKDDFLATMYDIWLDKDTSDKEYAEALFMWYILWDWCRQWWKDESKHTDIYFSKWDYNRMKPIIESLWFWIREKPKNIYSIIDWWYMKSTYKWLNCLSLNKFIDNSVFWKWKRFKRWVVDWLISTDWYIQLRKINGKDWYKRKWHVQIEYSTMSEQLATDFQLLLSDLWIISIKHKAKIYTTNFNKSQDYSRRITISDFDSVKKIFDNCDLSNKKNYQEVIDFINTNTWYTNNNIWIIPKIAWEEAKTSRKNRKPFYNFQRHKCKDYWIEHRCNYSWHRVVSVEKISHWEVIDIECSWDSTYRIDWILTHNTLLWSYLIVRELRRMPDSIKQIQRTVKSFYVAPSEDKFKEVVDYIKTAAESIRLLRVIEFNKKENRLYLFDEKLWRWKKVQTTVSSCDFVSAKWYEPWRWKASDFILVDEAAFVPEEVRLNILPILSNEKAKFYAVSTIQRESMRNWFYEQLVDAEMWYDDESIWMRVTIDDLEETLIAHEDKDRMKRSLKHNPQRYYAELYATFPNSQNVFNAEWFFNISRECSKDEICKGIIIGYDPAKRSDTWAVIVWEIRQISAYSTLWAIEYIEFIEEYWLTWEYTQQKEFIRNLKQSFIMKWLPTMLIMDCTWVWEAVSEMMGNIVDFKVLYTANAPRPTIDSYWAWKVSKQLLVHWMQLLMEKNKAKAFSWLIKLMDEMKYFTSYSTSAWNTKYEASAWHDDFVNAMMLVWFRYNYINWNIHTMWTGSEIRFEWVNPKTWLYEPFCMRSDWSERKLKWNSYWFWC